MLGGRGAIFGWAVLFSPTVGDAAIGGARWASGLGPGGSVGHRLLGWLGTPVPALLTNDFFCCRLFGCGAILLVASGLLAGLFLIAGRPDPHPPRRGALLFPLVGRVRLALILWRTLRRFRTIFVGFFPVRG